MTRSSNESFDDTAAEALPSVPEYTVSAPSDLASGTTTSPMPLSSGPEQTSAGPHVHYDLNVDTQLPPAPTRLSPLSATNPSMIRGVTRSDTELSRIGVRRRNTRANTFKTIAEFDEPGWHPGQRPGAEPGVDTSKPDGGHSATKLQAECQITIVDFSPEHFAIHELDNSGLIAFLQVPQPKWVQCRWINVNGLSWDVIQALGIYKKLHSLAIEDIMMPRNRTKVDWYQNHAFLVLTCQKLVQMLDPENSDDDEEFEVRSTRSHGSRMKRKASRWWTKKKASTDTLENGRPVPTPSYIHHQATGFSDVFNPQTLCTLQRYQTSSNEARTDYMERHSALASRGLAVMAEQVAMFITSDNTVIAFFEQSADDVEKPILARLSSPDTILRQSCDASMVGQAIIDAIIDMAIPVAACYAEVVGDLELDVLTKPNIKQTKSLYIIMSEINKMSSLVNPIISLIAALRDHKTPMAQDKATKELQNPLEGVIITPMTSTYLGDVYDHCVLITESFNQIRGSADNMIDLIFNTISAYQNESMKQLTNFDIFDALRGDVTYFWWIAIPLVVATILVLMGEVILQKAAQILQRRRIFNVRRRKKERIEQEKKRQRTTTF